MQARITLTPSMVAEFVAVASKCPFDVDIAGSNRYYVDAKSLVGVFGLDLNRPLTVSYDGFNPEFESYLRRCAMAV